MNIVILTNSFEAGQRYGYSVVAWEVANVLRDAGHQVFAAGMQSIHPPYMQDGILWLGVYHHPYYQDVFEHLFPNCNIDVVITINDIWVPDARFFPTFVKKSKATWIYHTTLYSAPLSPLLYDACNNADVIIAPSEFNYELLKGAGYEAKSVLIHHGVNTTTYKPCDENKKIELKKQFGLENKFVVLSVGRNNGPQKDFATLLQAWKLFLEKNDELKQKAILLLLTDPQESQGHNLILVRQHYGLQNSVKFINYKFSDDFKKILPVLEGTPKSAPHQANYVFQPEEMTEIYQMSDVYVTCSNGESFCLPILEAQACGIPCLVPAFSAMKNILDKSQAGFQMPLRAEYLTQQISNVYLPHPQYYADKLFELYNNNSLRDELKNKAIEFIKTHTEYHWLAIRQKWVDVVAQIEKQRNTPILNYETGELGI